MRYKITIPTPCHEDWNTMTATEKGAFCGSCSKEVVDFTASSKTELAQKIAKGAKLCGRFTPEQLNVPLPSVSRNQFRRSAFLLGFTSVLVLANPVMAQEKPERKPRVEVPRTDVLLGRIATPQVAEETTFIKGKVLEMNHPVSGAHIVVKDTDIKVVTDEQGNFSIAVPTKLFDNPQSLLASRIGYETSETSICVDTAYIEVQLISNEHILGEIAVEPY